MTADAGELADRTLGGFCRSDTRSGGELIDVLETYGVTADLTTDDDRTSLDRLTGIW